MKTLRLNRGASLVARFVLVDGSDVEQDIGEVETASVEIRESAADSAEAVVTLSTWESPSRGTIDFEIEPTDLDDVEPGLYWGYLQATLENGDVIRTPEPVRVEVLAS